jgi:hypothetical protein
MHQLPGPDVSGGTRQRHHPIDLRSGCWALCGLLLATLMIAIAWATGKYGNARCLGELPLWLALTFTAAGIYLVASLIQPSRGARVVFMIVIALAMRLSLCFTLPIASTDYNRYLWDGAVTAAGADPYRFSPRQVLKNEAHDPRIQRLAGPGLGLKTLQRVNCAHLRTIYPPVAQGLFAIAYWISPFDVLGWRIMLLFFDALAAIAVLVLLRRVGLPLVNWAIYLWNPLLVSETYLGGHLDIIAAALVIAFAAALFQRRTVLAAVLLALAAGTKLWPMLLVFFLVRPVWRDYRRMAWTLGSFAAISAAILVPFAIAAAGPDSGLEDYGRHWVGGEGAYRFLEDAAQWLVGVGGFGIDPAGLARKIMMGVLLLTAAWLGLRKWNDISTLCRYLAMTVMVMLLVSPILWPWYYLAVVPLAAVAGSRLAFLAWTLLLPLCYLPDNTVTPNQLLIFMHLPVWILLFGEGFLAKRLRLGRRASGAIVIDSATSKESGRP